VIKVKVYGRSLFILSYVLGVLQTVTVDRVASTSKEYSAASVARIVLGSNGL